MGHHHHHSHLHGHHHHSEADTKNISIAFFLNLAFTIIEIFGGIMCNSVAIMSDALHDLGDSLSLGLAWYFQKISAKKRDNYFSYGYRRFSLLGALINSIVLILGSIFILFETIPRLLHPEETNAQGMILLAILGVFINGIAVLQLKKGSSLNERVVSLHLLEDVLGWVAVLIGAILIYFFDWYIIDPLLSIFIAGFILYNVYGNLKEALNVVLQGIPMDTDLAEIEKILLKNKHVEQIHDLHVWSMDGEYNILTVHLVVDETLTFEQLKPLKKDLRAELEKKGIKHATLEVEIESCEYEDCM